MSADTKDSRSPLDLVSRLLAALPLPAFVVDDQHAVRYMNRAARQRAPELNEGHSPCYARVFHRDAPCELCVMTEAMADGADEVLCSQEIAGQQVRATGMRFVDGDGTAYVAEIVHMGGEGLVSSRSTMDLREDAMLSVIDSSNEVVLLFDADYRAVIVNRLAQVTLGYTAAEFAELTLVELGIAKSPEDLGKLLARADIGAPASARAVILASQGGKMPVKVSLSLLVGSSTRVVGACTFAAPRYSSAGLPALQRSVPGPLPKPGPGTRPALPSQPKPPAVPAKPASKAPAAPATPKSGSGSVRRVSESLEALAGDLGSGAAAAPKDGATKAPTKPASTAPSKPASTAPSKPATKAPSKPATRAPSKPASRAPSKPATRAPSKPAATAPSKSASRAPSKPATKAPSKPATKAPSKPATKAPSKPAATAPSKPASRAPSKPATTAPSKPATKAPSKPVAAPPPVLPKEVTVQVVAEPSVVAAASETIEALLGYASSEVVTWTAQDWFTRVHEPQLAADLANMWSGLVGQVFEPGALPDQIMEYPLIRKDGSVVDCSTTWRAVQGADGTFEGLEVVIRPKPS